MPTCCVCPSISQTFPASVSHHAGFKSLLTLLALPNAKHASWKLSSTPPNTTIHYRVLTKPQTTPRKRLHNNFPSPPTSLQTLSPSTQKPIPQKTSHLLQPSPPPPQTYRPTYPQRIQPPRQTTRLFQTGPRTRPGRFRRREPLIKANPASRRKNTIQTRGS